MISQEAWMDLKLLHRQGMSLRAISRATGLARQSVKRALAQTVPSTYKPRPPRPHKLDPFKEHLGTELGARPSRHRGAALPRDHPAGLRRPLRGGQGLLPRAPAASTGAPPRLRPL